MSADIEVHAGPAGSRSPHGGGRSFFLRYLGRELGRRARQATVIALGLALGIGLVITVSAAAAGVKNAQASVLHSLYGVGTDITVTQSPKAGSGLPGRHQSPSASRAGTGPEAHGLCQRQVQVRRADDRQPVVRKGTINYSEIAKIAKLAHVTAVAGGLRADRQPDLHQLEQRQPADSVVGGREWTWPMRTSAR